MKNIPLLVCGLLGLLFLPWHFILPEPREPHPEITVYTNALVTKYQEDLASRGLTDARPVDYITLELGREAEQKNRSIFTQYPDFARQYENLVWANRTPPYFTRLLQNLYGQSNKVILWDRAWIVPAALMLLFFVLRAVIGMLPRSGPSKNISVSIP